MILEQLEAIREQRRQVIKERLESRRLRSIQPSELPLPSEPTSFACGSIAKIELMRQRAERGESVFHPCDTRAKIERKLEAFADRLLEE